MKKEEIRYCRDILLKDPRFAGYQKDFLAAVINKPFTPSRRPKPP